MHKLAVYKLFFIAFLCSSLAACTSIPLSTMLKLAKLDEHYLTQLNAADIQAKITVNDFVKPDLNETKLALVVTNKRGEMALNFPLELISVEQHPASSSFFNSQPAKQSFLLKLSADAIDDFVTLQHQISTEKDNQFAISVDAKLTRNEQLTKQQQEATIVMSIALKLKNDEGFFMLFENVELKGKITEL